jgi:hypothetical protein
MRRADRLAPLAWLFFALGCRASQASTDPLSSWNDGPAKKAIVSFVRDTTAKGGAHYLPPDNRFATFDNDGTLWVEQPMYTELAFAIDRLEVMAPKHPEWKEQEPIRAILSHDHEAMAKLGAQDIGKVVAVTHSGMTTDDFQRTVEEWLETANHPRFRVHYTDLAYEPMLELLAYLRANGFKTYIVTGGGQDFVRAYSNRTYGVPVEQVLGTAGRVKYEYGANGQPLLVKLPEVMLVDDKTGKPEGIHFMMGRRPSAAFGNSIGDQQMLEYTEANGGAHLMLLVHHDDAVREYAYGPESKIGTFSDELMSEARQRGWTIVSMKNDWKRIFP